MALQVGFLHSDEHGRNSLTWDCIEPLRAKINARVFAFVGSHEFSRSDFPACGVKVHRIARPVIAQLLRDCLLPDRDILDATEWLAALIMRYGAPGNRRAARIAPSAAQTQLSADGGPKRSPRPAERPRHASLGR
jgi:hypothetical protein